MSTKAPNPVDKYVGSRVRMRRIMLGMSQEKLGEALGLTFQQVQKYEKGTNRISAGRLQRISEVLTVPVSFFFAGFDDKKSGGGQSVDVEFGFLQTEGALRLARAYARIKKPGVRLQLLRLTEAIAGD
jgi:transcriptional regulator with XRE-family HTH domain